DKDRIPHPGADLLAPRTPPGDPRCSSSPAARPPTTTGTAAPVPRIGEDAPRISRRRHDAPSAPRCERPASAAAARLPPDVVLDAPPPQSDLRPPLLESRALANARARAPSVALGRPAHTSKVERAAQTAEAIHQRNRRRTPAPPRTERR